MDASVHQQIISLIERSQRILLATHRKPDGDAVGSLMALTSSLNLLGKEVTATCSDSFPDHFDFLPDVSSVRQHIPGGRDFVVTLDCDKTEVDRLKYHLEDNKIHIVITPKKGHFVKENVSCHEKGGNYDLIITVDVADVPQLGTLYEENSDLFTSVPLVNIDHHVSNTNFGKVNYIDVASSSTAEMLYGLIRDMEKHFNKSLIVPDVATFLLSGVTTDTGSFQNANTTPRAMEVAAELMDAGANQHDVIKYLFRTKKLSTLKLWGKILSKIEVDAKHRMVWSSITQQDLKQSGAHMDEAGDIIDELMVHAPEAEMVALFKEDSDMISVSFRSTTSQANVMEVAKRFGGGGHVQAAGVKFPGKTLPEVMNQVLAAMQESQQRRLGLDGIEEEPDAEQQAPKVTQVLDGYTPPAPSVSPSLEQRAKNEESTVSGQQSAVEYPQSQDSALPGSPQVPTQPDLHDQTRAAITAEQSQSGDNGFNPSQSVQQKRPEKPQVDKRFQGDVPEYMRVNGQQSAVSGTGDIAEDQEPKVENQGGNPTPQASPQAPQPAPQPPAAPQPPLTPNPPVTLSPAPSQTPQAPAPPAADDGVKVSYGNAAPQPIPQAPALDDSSGVVVKNVDGQSSAVNSREPSVQSQEPNRNNQVPVSGGQASGTTGGAPGHNNQGTVGQQAAGQGSSQQQAGAQGAQAQNDQGTNTNQQQTGKGDQGGGAAGAAAASQKPEPPKDPFALGDDGLTDIERALGGL